MLHGKPDGKRLEKGDWVLFDFGALYNGFHADISRTFILGQASDEQRELYALLQKAQHEAVQASRHGVIGHFPIPKYARPSVKNICHIITPDWVMALDCRFTSYRSWVKPAKHA
jgi:methionine aminopeptidase